MSPLLFPGFLGAASCALLAFWLYSRKKTSINAFPSPPSDPLLGHLRIFPYTFPWVTFTEWSKQYGAIMQFNVPGKSIIVLSDAEDAHILLDKRGSNYSDRPRPILHGEIGGMEHFLGLVRYGDDFRILRRFITQYFNSRHHVSLFPLMSGQVKILLRNLLEDPEHFEHHLDRSSAGTVVQSTYGYVIQSNNDGYVKLAADAVIANASLGTIGLTPVDILPFLRYVPSWFPGGDLLRRARESKVMIDEVVDQPYERLKAQRRDGVDQSCFLDALLEIYEQTGTENARHELLMKSAAAQIYVAGVETSADTLLTFVHMMMSHPEVMRKAQAEIDEVIGNEHLPTLDDRPNLPYVECVLKETFRINPSAPLGFAHVSLKEDIYKGKVIPAGTLVIANIWAMMRDERRFHDPGTFNPDRFLTKVTTPESTHVHPLNAFKSDDPASLVFGFGRRICPGRFFADASAWITIASILSVFDILPPVDSTTGEEYMPKFEWIGGLTAKPKSFRARIIPRSDKQSMII